MSTFSKYWRTKHCAVPYIKKKNSYSFEDKVEQTSAILHKLRNNYLSKFTPEYKGTGHYGLVRKPDQWLSFVTSDCKRAHMGSQHMLCLKCKIKHMRLLKLRQNSKLRQNLPHEQADLKWTEVTLQSCLKLCNLNKLVISRVSFVMQRRSFFFTNNILTLLSSVPDV